MNILPFTQLSFLHFLREPSRAPARVKSMEGLSPRDTSTHMYPPPCSQGTSSLLMRAARLENVSREPALRSLLPISGVRVCRFMTLRLPVPAGVLAMKVSSLQRFLPVASPLLGLEVTLTSNWISFVSSVTSKLSALKSVLSIEIPRLW